MIRLARSERLGWVLGRVVEAAPLARGFVRWRQPRGSTASGRRRDLLASEKRKGLKRLCEENAELRGNAFLTDASVHGVAPSDQRLLIASFLEVALLFKLLAVGSPR